MTDPRDSSPTPRQDLIDTNALAYSGRALPAAVQAAKARRWGWWYQAEWRLLGMKAYWTTIVGWSLLTPILYLTAMGVGLGRLVDSSAGGIDGVPYLVFVAPGLLVSSVVMSASNEASFPVMDGFKWGRLYYARASTAASPTQVAIGELIAIGLRMAAEALLFWLVLVVAGATDPTTSWLMVPLAALAGMSFAAPLAAYSATLEDEGFQYSMIQRFIVMPMFLFAGTFFPLATMPGYLQWIGWISPMWHGTQLARAVSYGMPLTWGAALVHLGFLVALLAVGTRFAIRNFVRRLGK